MTPRYNLYTVVRCFGVQCANKLERHYNVNIEFVTVGPQIPRLAALLILAREAQAMATAPAAEPPKMEDKQGEGEHMVAVKVAWLKQKKDDDKRLPLLDFNDQQFYTFDRRWTSFRMVKHSCSYPAPPHKVRMWCSSLGASPDLPSTMDLNTFINTFELITEEKHTLKMAHLTGGETIAFEMVQGEQVSELSTFLLGAQLKQPTKIVTVDKKSLKDSLTQSVQKLADEFEVGRADLGAALAGAAGSHGAPLRFFEEEARIATVLKEQAVAAEEQRKKLADELIAEEEEEVCGAHAPTHPPPRPPRARSRPTILPPWQGSPRPFA